MLSKNIVVSVNGLTQCKPEIVDSKRVRRCKLHRNVNLP